MGYDILKCDFYVQSKKIISNNIASMLKMVILFLALHINVAK